MKNESPYISLNKSALECFLNSTYERPLTVTDKGIEDDDGNIVIARASVKDQMNYIRDAFSVAFKEMLD